MSTIFQSIYCYGVVLPYEFTEKYDLEGDNSELRPACLEGVYFGHRETNKTVLALESSIYRVESDSTENGMEVVPKFDYEELDALTAFCEQFSVPYQPSWYLGGDVS